MMNSYLRFLRLADTLTNSGDHSLDLLNKEMLEYISQKILINKKIFNVGDIVSLSHLGSQATLHKRLHSLVNDGYLALKAADDGRVKHIELTNKTHQYFANLAQALEKAAKA